MKLSPSLAMVSAAFVLFTGGCRSATSTALRVSAAQDVPFTVHYRAGGLTGDVGAIAKAGRADMVVELDVLGADFTFDLSKAEKSAHLSGEVVRGGKTVFRAEAPSGTHGVRVTRTANGWRQETY